MRVSYERRFETVRGERRVDGLELHAPQTVFASRRSSKPAAVRTSLSGLGRVSAIS